MSHTAEASAPTFNDAFKLARPMAMAGDRKGAAKLLSNLLWHVDSAHGGFIGLSDSQLADKCADDQRLDYAAAVEAMYAPTPWPVMA